MKDILSMVLFADPRSQGGIETFNRILKEFYMERFEMLTLSTDRVKIYDVPDVIEIGSNKKIFKILNKLSLNKLRKILTLREINKEKRNFIIFTFPFEGEIIKNIDAKKICVIHTTLDKYISILCEGKKEKLLNLIDYIDYFVVLSDYNAEALKKEIPELKDKVIAIRNSSKVERFLGKKEKNKNLVMINRIENFSKRLDLAIKAMKRLPDYTLNIYGKTVNKRDAEDFKKLKEIIHKNNITNVYFKGATDNVQEKLDESGIFIMTSDFEGYPMAAIEAMRRGLPIVLRNTFDSARDIIPNNENGILLDKEWNEEEFVKAIEEVYDNYESYSINSQLLSKRYDKEIIKKEWDKILK